MALDFLILYEHTVREYESDLLLKLELERRGYTVRIRQLLDAKDLRLFGKDKPEVLVASCMYDNEAINSHVYNNIGKCNKIVNLHWEQMLSDTQEEGDWFNMNGNAKRCVQTCWGQRTAQRLQAHGMDAKNTPVTGAVMMDFLRPEFKGYFKDKETLCKEFGLDPAKQLHLYISSFGYASMTDQEVAELSKMAGTDFSGFARTNRVSMEKTLAWFDRYLGDHPEVELVYRRHPSEWKCKALDELAANIAANKLLTSNDPGGLGYNVFTVPDGQNLIGENGRLNPRAKQGRLVTDAKGQQFYLQPDNWLDEIYKSSSFRQEYNVSVSGATDRANFFASLGYLDNTGIVDGSSNERYTARLRADYQAKKWLKVGGNMSYTHFVWNNGNQTNDDGDGQGEGNADGGNAFATAIRMAPIYPVYMRDGNGNIMIDEYGFKMYDTGDGRNGGALRTNGGKSNDLQDIQLNKYINEGNAFMANGFADFSLYKGLKLTLNGSVSLDETRGTEVSNPYYGQFAESGGAVFKSHSREIAYNMQQFLTYTNTFADVHNLDLLFGHEMYNRKSYGLYGSKTMMFSPDNPELSGAVVDSSRSGSSVLEYNNEGYFFRGQYDYDNRIYFSGSYRRDASSRFHPDHRWGNFWSLGAAWIINRESWFNASWVNMLKVKASYGSQGNDNLGSKAESYYRYTDYREILSSGDGVTSVLYQKGNPDITWETNANLNVGVEFGLWDNRLSGSIDVFNRKTTDMLFELATPIESGYTTIFTNIGDMVNRGLEIELNADLIRTKNLVWDFSLNMTHYKNKVTHLPEQFKNNTTADGKHVGRWQDTKFLTEGESVFSFYVPTYAGVDPETGKSLWYTYKTDDAGNKERIKTSDYSVASQEGREMHGDALPDVYGGFGTSLRFYGVDFSIGFTYQLGGQVLDQGYRFYMNSPAGTSTGNNYHHDLLNSWTPENSGSNIPRFAYNDSNQAAVSDRFLTSASYLNIQNITLGYTLPKRITRKFLVENLRIYLACDNVWYWSKRQGLDPRQSINGITNPYYYAPIRTFSGGVTVTF